MKSRVVTPKPPKSSRGAIRLLGELHRQERSWAKVAVRLGMDKKRKDVCWQVFRGQLRETSEIKAAVRRAKARERRAFAGFRVPKVEANLDREQLQIAKSELHRVLTIINSLLEVPTNGRNKTQTTTEVKHEGPAD